MTDTLIAFDELDSTLGFFFQLCKDDIEIFFKGEGIEFTILKSNILNDLAVKFAVEKYDKFIFGAYSHGRHNCLLKSASTPYISHALNGESFKNSFFYTWSCDCGEVLGAELVNSGCFCFIGYKDKVAIWSTYTQPFVECANYGLVQFILGSKSFDVLSAMKKKYNEEVDKIYRKHPIIASILVENRNALVLRGRDIAINDLA